jgi:hypothetical protein
MKTKLTTFIFLALAGIGHAQNVFVTNDTNHAIPVTGTISGGGGDASAANQTNVQANAGSDATKAISIQGITSGKAVPVSAASLPLPSGASTAAKQPALGTAGSASADVITIQGVASMTKLLVTPDANSAVNVAQINGVTPLMGAGNTGTGSPRVTIATDQANVPVAVKTAVGPGTIATGQVTTSTTAGTMVAANATRRRCILKNTDASITVTVGPATVTTGNGMPLKAGESLEVRWTGLIQVISASGTPVVAYMDESD